MNAKNKKDAPLNDIELLLMTTSFYVRTKCQFDIQDKKLMPLDELIDFMQKIKDTNIVLESLKVILAMVTECSYHDINKSVGDIRNRVMTGDEAGKSTELLRQIGLEDELIKLIKNSRNAKAYTLK